MHKTKLFFGIALFAFATVVFVNSKISKAQEVNPDAVLQRRQQLEAQLKQLEDQINSFSTVIQDAQNQSASLERDIAILDAQIKRAKLEIKARTIAISQLEDGIYQKKLTINDLDAKNKTEKDSLAELLRQTDQTDKVNLFELMLGYNQMSDFFMDADSVVSLQDAVQKTIDEIKININVTEQQKQDLEDKKAEELQLKTLQEMESKRIGQAEADKKNLLATTKGQEKKYQQMLTQRKKDAASIRSQLFFLTGSPSIPFEKAVEYATFAWKATGVRPAFLLGLVTEESNLGKNIGTGSMATDMASSRCSSLKEAFLRITSELGLDPNTMPVSRKAWYGYCGGAMGPAQFMSTTWEGFKNRISAITGNNPPNPWDPKDAFVAAALYLKDSGAVEGNTESERIAALKYLAGANWRKSSYRFYGDDVMGFAAKYQEQINIIKGMSSSGSSSSGG